MTQDQFKIAIKRLKMSFPRTIFKIDPIGKISMEAAQLFDDFKSVSDDDFYRACERFRFTIKTLNGPTTADFYDLLGSKLNQDKIKYSCDEFNCINGIIEVAKSADEWNGRQVQDKRLCPNGYCTGRKYYKQFYAAKYFDRAQDEFMLHELLDKKIYHIEERNIKKLARSVGKGVK